MKRVRLMAGGAWLLGLFELLGGCASHPGPGRGAEAASHPAPFVLGADLSALDAPRRAGPGGARAYQENGVVSDELTILRSHGWNAFRVRVFVDPVRKAPNNTLDAAIPLAQRIKAAHATLLLDLHLSDTWADPQHQEIPVAWRSLDFGQLEKQVESYSYDTVKRLKDAGAMPDWVQVGNEITHGTLWPLAQLGPPHAEGSPPDTAEETEKWDHLTRILKAGIRGVNRAAGDTPPRIAIHIDKGANWAVTRWFFDHLNEAHVPYDIIAQSFYPEWNHGTLGQVWDNLNRSAERYHKDFLVVETGYGRSHVPNNQSMLWPQTPAGRLQFMADIISTVQKAPHGLGVMYWAPEREAWNDDGTPGPVVSVLGQVDKLSGGPESHAPAAALLRR